MSSFRELSREVNLGLYFPLLFCHAGGESRRGGRGTRNVRKRERGEGREGESKAGRDLSLIISSTFKAQKQMI